MTDQNPHIAAIYRYPLKGLTPEKLDATTLEIGQTLPYDRAFAIENGKGRFDSANPKYLPKINFLMLMRHERLATLESVFDEESMELTILRDGKQVIKGALSTPLGRQMLEQFFAAYFQKELKGAPHIVHAKDHSFSDVAAKCLHIVNLASVRELERVMGKPINPLRFRANLYIDGLPPWQELDLVDCQMDAGAARLKVFKRTVRCEATNVDPETAQRDGSIPATLQRTFGHSDFGIYAKTVKAGTIKTGDNIEIK